MLCFVFFLNMQEEYGSFANIKLIYLFVTTSHINKCIFINLFCFLNMSITTILTALRIIRRPRSAIWHFHSILFIWSFTTRRQCFLPEKSYTQSDISVEDESGNLCVNAFRKRFTPKTYGCLLAGNDNYDKIPFYSVWWKVDIGDLHCCCLPFPMCRREYN